MKKLGLTNNQLKLIAMLTMTIDHVGMLLLPACLLLRLIGRLAFPVFAYMVAEGCRYTRSLPKYLVSMASVALVCQVVSFFATGSVAQCILVTFSLSVLLIILLRKAREEKTVFFWVLFSLALCMVLAVTEFVPQWLPGTDFSVDYGFIGAIFPVCVYAANTKGKRLAASAVCLSLLASYSWPGQWTALLAVPLLALYNEKRGKWKMKWLFYLYYPFHLAVIWAVSFLL